ncbi:unnamed protein product [Trichobilharzia regenti]|nr:unnamed protein product [Trichobilharzia regenti]
MVNTRSRRHQMYHHIIETLVSGLIVMDVLEVISVNISKVDLVYDPVTKTSRDPKDVDVLFPGWGETWSIENLDSYKHGKTQYCAPIIESLRLDPFFKSNFTMRGAPFDFHENNQFVDKLKLLIEETFQNGGNQPVVLVGHSLGAKYALYFLKSMTKSWKRLYIKTFVSLSAPLGGSVKALKIEASGMFIVSFSSCVPFFYMSF